MSSPSWLPSTVRASRKERRGRPTAAGAASRSRTLIASARRSTSIARHSRVYSSTSVSIFRGRPSEVRSATKSYDQTCFGQPGRSRKHAPSFNHRRPRRGCCWGTLSPSCRQILSTRLWFTRHPSRRNSAVGRSGARSRTEPGCSRGAAERGGVEGRQRRRPRASQPSRQPGASRSTGVPIICRRRRSARRSATRPSMSA